MKSGSWVIRSASATMLSALRLVTRRRMPKWGNCLLWGLVAVCLMCPVLPESVLSVRPQPGQAALPAAAAMETASPGAGITLTDLAWVWLVGMAAVLGWAAVSYLRLRRQVAASIRVGKQVYLCDDISSPFILGIFRPRVYLPSGLEGETLQSVLRHEGAHLRRRDHWWKPLGHLLVAVYWFHPLIWAAYVLLGRDMERACDEMVLKNATPSQRAAYSRALVACAAQPKMAAVCPLAFGEVAVKERVKNVLNYKKPALWAVILLVVAAAIIAVCLLTKPAGKDAGVPDAETLYALRTEYIGDNAAVSGILDALGFRAAGAAGDGQAYTYSFEVETASEPYGVVVRYTFAGALPQRSAEWNRQMAQRGYIALALIDNAEWLRWEDIGAEGETPVSGTVYAGDYVAADYNAVRGSAAGLQALMDTLQACLEDGSIVYYEGGAQPSFEETMPWSVTGDNDPCSVRAEDYGIVYDAAQLPDWETVPLSYLCAYYLNGDGAYAEGAMDVLAQRYSQLPQQVRRYIRTLSGQADPRGNGDAAEALLRDISRYITSQLTGGLPVTVSYEKDQLSIAVTEVYSVVYRTVKYDENYSEDIPVYEVGSGAQLSVIKGEGFTLYGRYNEENVALHNGDVVELTEQFVGLGMDGQYAVRFQYRSAAETAELEVYQITWETGGSAKQVVPLTEEQVQAIQSEKGLVQPEWYLVSAQLRQGDEDVAYYMGNDYKPVPPTVLKILTEQCGYTFVTPADFRGNMTSAKLEFYGGETYTAAKADLPALQRMLTNARAYGGGTSCGFGAKLTVTFDDGRTVSVLKGTDSCASFTFGSWNAAMVSDSENRQFWQMFGVPFEG